MTAAATRVAGGRQHCDGKRQSDQGAHHMTLAVQCSLKMPVVVNNDERQRAVS
jgi:hypothetical protein